MKKKTSWNKPIYCRSKQNDRSYVSPYIAKNGDCIYMNKIKSVSDYLYMREMLKKKGLTY